MNEINKKIEEILVEGLATSPSRCWVCESRTPEKEVVGKREENLAHISGIAEELYTLYTEMVEGELSGIEKVMREAFDEVLDEYAPKKPDGSIERQIGLIVGATIIAKTKQYLLERNKQ